MNTKIVLPGLLLPNEPERKRRDIAPHWEVGSEVDQRFHSGPTEKEESGRTTSGGRQKLLLNVREAADLLSLGRTLVYELVLRNQIASIKIGRCRRIPITALEDFVAEQLNQVEAGGKEDAHGKQTW